MGSKVFAACGFVHHASGEVGPRRAAMNQETFHAATRNDQATEMASSQLHVHNYQISSPLNQHLSAGNPLLWDSPLCPQEIPPKKATFHVISSGSLCMYFEKREGGQCFIDCWLWARQFDICSLIEQLPRRWAILFHFSKRFYLLLKNTQIN